MHAPASWQRGRGTRGLPFECASAPFARAYSAPNGLVVWVQSYTHSLSEVKHESDTFGGWRLATLVRCGHICTFAGQGAYRVEIVPVNDAETWCIQKLK